MKSPKSWVYFHLCIFIMNSRTILFSHRVFHTPLFPWYFTLFILRRLILGRHFLWSPIYVSSQAGLSLSLPTVSSLISSASCLRLPLHVHSMKQWYFLVTSSQFVSFKKKKRGEDKWKEGERGCEDNGFLWWLTFHSGASKKVWLSYCVFADSQMNGGSRTGWVCDTEGNKQSMSNLHLICLCVSEHLLVCLCVNLDWHIHPLSSPRADPRSHKAAVSEHFLSVSESGGELTNRSFSLSGGITRFLPCCCCDTPVTWSNRDRAA